MVRKTLDFPHLQAERVLVVEDVFLAVAEQWQGAATGAALGQPQEELHHQLSLACLYLSVNAGTRFSPRAERKIRQCLKAAGHRNDVWPEDRLVWKLCLAGCLKYPYRTIAVNTLIENLDHPRSGIRKLVLEMGWIVRSWLGHPSARYHLLANLAFSHLDSDKAVVLARALSENDVEFDKFVREYPFIDWPADTPRIPRYPAPASLASRYFENYEELTGAELREAEEGLVGVECRCAKVVAETLLALVC